MISVRDITKRYGPIAALDGVSFDIRPKEVVGFLGPNGAGKSTTMKILTGVLAPSSGEVRIDGLNALDHAHEIRSRIGYLPENNPVYTDMRVEGFLRFIGQLRGMDEETLSSRIEAVLGSTGTRAVRRRFIGELSKGFRQRVGLAAALLPDPEILILDEPTVGLDPKQIIEIRELIRRVGEEKTVILCSHILPEVQATCSRIIIINQGRIVASGAPDELAARMGGAALFELVVQGPQAAVEAAIRRVPGIAEIEARPEQAGTTRFRLRCAADADPRADLFRSVVAGGWTLLELKAHQANLEDVFLNLTTTEA